MTFSSKLQAETASLLERILDLPFNRELAAGTLSAERFQHYVVQDALYLVEYARVLAHLAALAPEPSAIALFAKAAEGAVLVERSLHASYFALFDIAPEQVATAEPSLTCQAYTDFLHASASRDGFAVGAAAILPCFRIYWDVGRRIAAATVPENPYAAWIDTYADPAFGDAVLAAEAAVDQAALAASATTQATMAKAYHRSARYEWLFWDSAYRLEIWPVEHRHP